MAGSDAEGHPHDPDIPKPKRPSRAKKPKRPASFKTSYNSIKPGEVESAPMPPAMLPPPKRESISDYISVRYQVDGYFAKYPEKKMLVWRKLWRSTSTARAAQARAEIRLQTMHNTDKYIIARQGKYLWFTVRPDPEDETPEQAAAYARYLAHRGTRGRKPKMKEEPDDEAVDAGFFLGSQGDPGHEVLGGTERDEGHDDRPAHGRDE